jgi:hypothetical protein
MITAEKASWDLAGKVKIFDIQLIEEKPGKSIIFLLH